MKVALLPGGFKPPHLGHYNMAKYLADFADNVIVRIGSKEREGIGPELALEIFNYYKASDPDPRAQKLTISLAQAASPVKDVYDFVELEAKDGDILSFIKGEKDSEDPRFARIPTYAEKFGKNITTKSINISNKTDRKGYPVSGTWMRGYIKKNNFQDFRTGLPKHLSAEQENEAWAIVIGLTDYSSPKGGTQSSQFEENTAPKEMAGRIKSVFDKVNGAQHPVQTPQWHKNRFKSKYGISFPETLKDINKEQALAMNKYANDMKIREAAKPDFLDLDGDGDKKETMKKAAKDKKKSKNMKNKIKEDISDDISKAEDEVQKAKETGQKPDMKQIARKAMDMSRVAQFQQMEILQNAVDVVLSTTAPIKPQLTITCISQ